MARKNPHAVALGRKGGKVKSAAKAAAAKENAKLAGRKPKFEVGDRAAVNDKAPAAYRGRRGRVTAVGTARASFVVEFSDRGEPAVGQLRSWCLDTFVRS